MYIPVLCTYTLCAGGFQSPYSKQLLQVVFGLLREASDSTRCAVALSDSSALVPTQTALFSSFAEHLLSAVSAHLPNCLPAAKRMFIHCKSLFLHAL